MPVALLRFVDRLSFLLHYAIHRVILHPLGLVHGPYRRHLCAVASPAVLVTGTSSGVGRAIALHLAHATGFTVYATVRREADGDSLLADFRKYKEPHAGALHIVVMDVLVAADVNAFHARVVAEHINLVGIVNNAGIAKFTALGAPDFLDVCREVMELNYFAPLRIVHTFADVLRREKGRVVHIGSMGAHIGGPGNAPYGAAKAALESMSRSHMIEEAPNGVAVSNVVLGTINTNVWHNGARFLEVAKTQLAGTPDGELAKVSSEFVAYGIGNSSHDASHAVRAVEHALTAAWPKRVYYSGWDARTLLCTSSVFMQGFADMLLTTMFYKGRRVAK